MLLDTNGQKGGIQKMIEVEEMLSREETAKRLGITPKTLSVWIKEGKVKAARPGRSYKIPKSEIGRCLSTEAAK